MRLIYPNKRYLEQFKMAQQEYKENNVTYFKGFYSEIEGLITRYNNYRFGKNLKPDRVPQTTYWLVDKGELIGMINIRHYLNEDLMQHGGHIGYGIRVPYQKMGYGTKILALGLEKAREMGLKRVLVTCLDENIGSQKVIERNGGVLENKIILPPENNVFRRYWIEL